MHIHTLPHTPPRINSQLTKQATVLFNAVVMNIILIFISFATSCGLWLSMNQQSLIAIARPPPEGQHPAAGDGAVVLGSQPSGKSFISNEDASTEATLAQIENANRRAHVHQQNVNFVADVIQRASAASNEQGQQTLLESSSTVSINTLTGPLLTNAAAQPATKETLCARVALSEIANASDRKATVKTQNQQAGKLEIEKQVAGEVAIRAVQTRNQQAGKLESEIQVAKKPARSSLFGGPTGKSNINNAVAVAELTRNALDKNQRRNSMALVPFHQPQRYDVGDDAITVTLTEDLTRKELDKQQRASSMALVPFYQQQLYDVRADAITVTLTKDPPPLWPLNGPVLENQYHGSTQQVYDAHYAAAKKKYALRYAAK